MSFRLTVQAKSWEQIALGQTERTQTRNAVAARNSQEALGLVGEQATGSTYTQKDQAEA